jgi:hypothetical protein
MGSASWGWLNKSGCNSSMNLPPWQPWLRIGGCWSSWWMLWATRWAQCPYCWSARCPWRCEPNLHAFLACTLPAAWILSRTSACQPSRCCPAPRSNADTPPLGMEARSPLEAAIGTVHGTSPACLPVWTTRDFNRSISHGSHIVILQFVETPNESCELFYSTRYSWCLHLCRFHDSHVGALGNGRSWAGFRRSNSEVCYHIRSVTRNCLYLFEYGARTLTGHVHNESHVSVPLCCSQLSHCTLNRGLSRQ